MSAATANACKLCVRNGKTTQMLVRFPGAAPVCPECDRRKCGACKTILVEGTETRCPSCRRDVSLVRGSS